MALTLLRPAGARRRVALEVEESRQGSDAPRTSKEVVSWISSVMPPSAQTATVLLELGLATRDQEGNWKFSFSFELVTHVILLEDN